MNAIFSSQMLGITLEAFAGTILLVLLERELERHNVPRVYRLTVVWFLGLAIGLLIVLDAGLI